ncbi:MAG: adenylate/guanylate cyclase domain-containing protein [Planctomycetes bacterium]|nr:adenylate/guanylate cyclase domain-containing protein [Planctomycetota bacterium]MCW8134447.1 adenylate/guanylate cyclase domain-containing protein [Planctomycetota bacterium]
MARGGKGVRIPKWVRRWFEDGETGPFYEWTNGEGSGWVQDLPGWQRVGEFSDIEPDYESAEREGDELIIPGRVGLSFEDAKGGDDSYGDLGSGTCDFVARFDLLTKHVSVEVHPVDLDELLQPDWPLPDVSLPLHALPRRVVAAFLDIRGFTAWLNQTPDRTRNAPLLMREFWRLVIEATEEGPLQVQRKPLGDGCMFLWLPEDTDEGLAKAIQQAISSLMAILRGWAELDKKSKFQCPKGVGAAIATGEALFLKQSLEGSEGENFFDVIGVPLNLAARICSQAQPGQILATADIPKQLPRPVGFKFEPWAAQSKAKGFTDDVLEGIQLVKPGN